MRFPNFEPKTCLDFGAGLTPSSLYINELFPGCKTKAIEPNEYMRNLGKFICKKKENIDYHTNLFDSIAYQE